MGRTKKSRATPYESSRGNNITQDTFRGLNIGLVGLEPITRNVPPPKGNEYESRQKAKRETLRKVEHDMTRTLHKEVLKALNNQVILPFYISDFEAARKKGIPLHHKQPFGALSDKPTRLTVEKGPSVVTDLDGIPVLWYFPRFIGKGLQINLLKCIENLAHAYRPPKDTGVNDRRGTSWQSNPEELSAPNKRYVTRSQRPDLSGTEVKVLEDDEERQAEINHGSVCVSQELDIVPGCQVSSQMYEEDDGEVRLEGLQLLPTASPNKQSKPTQDSVKSGLNKYEPFAYYFSPGWCQTGMQYVRPIQMSAHFRNALQRAPSQTVEFLESKRLLDQKIAQLVDIIHPSLGESMRTLQGYMSSVQGPTQVAVVNGWTSAFPCFGVAINRVTGMHRDHRGMRGGLDIIGVLGTFTSGGDLDLPDLNLRVEWTQGCLGAIDGHSFRHRVHDWSGGSRATLISFCQKATWSSLGLDSALIRPTISECHNRLSAARAQRSRAIQEALSNNAALGTERNGYQPDDKMIFLHDDTGQAQSTSN